METRAIGIAELLGGAAVLVIGVLVVATARTRPGNRLLAALFFVDGSAQIVWGVHDYLRGVGRIAEASIQLGFVLIGMGSILRGKLGLSDADASAIESELVSSLAGART